MDDKRNIKGIFFDFDGVVTNDKNGTPLIISYISKNTGLPLEKVDVAYRRYNEDMLMGKITHKEMWAPFCREVGMDIDYGILEKAFLSLKLDDKMIELILKYKEKYHIGLITDNKVDRIETIIENTRLKGLFDTIIISANIRSRKNEETIFLSALKESGLKACECVYIDNNKKNLIVPKKLGFTTILFDNINRDYLEISRF